MVAKNISLVIETTGKSASDIDSPRRVLFFTTFSAARAYLPALAHPSACIISTDQQTVCTESSQITLILSH